LVSSVAQIRATSLPHCLWPFHLPPSNPAGFTLTWM
jgi:hypothetical protein